MTSFLVSGPLAGVVGLVVFLGIHHLWIRPIWSIFVPGLLIAALGGVAVGWSYHELLPHLPPRPWTFFAVVALIVAILAPSVLLGQVRPALLDTATFSIRPGEGMAAATRFSLELVLTAMIAGAGVGWFIARTPGAALATAVAGFVFAIGPGHNIPLLANTPVVMKGLALLLVIVIVSAIVLVEVNAWIAGR